MPVPDVPVLSRRISINFPPHSSASSHQGDLCAGFGEQCGGREEKPEKYLLVKTLQNLVKLQKSGRSPPDHHYFSLLKSCNTRKALALTTQVYEHIKQYEGHRVAGVLGDYLVISMVKCGSVDGALEVFHNMPHRSVYSWTALISGFTDDGQAEHALSLYTLMTDDGVQPNTYTFVSLLKASGCLAWPHQGHMLHSEVQKRGWAADIFIGSSLVSMYGKCGRLKEAEHLFCRLLRRNTVTWNGMLSAYVQQGISEKALHSFRQMVEELVPLNDMTYVIALQACSLLADEKHSIDINTNLALQVPFLICQALHADACKKGFMASIGSILVRVYGKCWTVKESENAFCALPSHNVTAWDAMIATYVENGQGKLSLQLFCHMDHMGVSPNEWTFVNVILACGIVAEYEESIEDTSTPTCLDIGQALHNDVKRMGFMSHVFVCTSILSMYSKIGTIDEAERVFTEMPSSNLGLWNAMLSAYVNQGQEELALQLYRQMINEDNRPNDQTFTIVMHACKCLAEKEKVLSDRDAKLVAYDIGRSLHADTLKERVASKTYVGNTLISMYGKCGKLCDAEHAFQDLLECNILSWNAMLSAYVENGFEKNALQFFLLMQKKDICMNKASFRIILQGCGGLLDKADHTTLCRQLSVLKSNVLKIVKASHADVEKEGLDKEMSLVALLITLYGKCEMVWDAITMFERLHQKDLFSCNAMLSIYAQHALCEKAFCLYSKMILTCGADEASVVHVLQACSESGRLNDAKMVHFAIVSAGLDSSHLVSTTLIHFYGNCKATVDAELVFDSILKPDVVSCSACLAGYAQEGNQIRSLLHFFEMGTRGVQPNCVMFLLLLHLCSHTGYVWEGLVFFEMMNRDFGIEPGVKFYAGVIDLLGRAGNFLKLRNVLSSLPPKLDNLPIWLCLLGICSMHSNMDLGLDAFDSAKPPT